MKTETGKIDQINLVNKTSAERLYLTFDMDLAHDDIIRDTAELLIKAQFSATWFVTHNTPYLDKLRMHEKFELGIHPNFNFLLNGDTRNGNSALMILNKLMLIVPEAKSVRSHSMTQSTVLLDLFRDKGITHDVNCFIPIQTGIEIKPWLLWNGLVRVPYCWEDDVHCMYQLNDKIEPYLKRPGLKVFNFHPIHVYLNTENLDRYERTRCMHQHPEELIKHRYEGYGTRNRLLEILDFVQNL